MRNATFSAFNSIKHGLLWLMYSGGSTKYSLNISRTKNDPTMKLFAHTHLSFLSIVSLAIIFALAVSCDFISRLTL